MTFSAQSNLSDLQLGEYLKIVSKSGVYNNLSEDSSIWDMVKKLKKGMAEGRELRYLLRTAYGAAAANFVAVDGGAYPTAQQATINEATAIFKDYALTLEVQRTLIEKAISDFARYGEPLAEEIRSKTIALSRQLSASLYGDGTGILAQAADAGTVDTGTDLVTFNVSTSSTAKGFIGWVELGDKVLVRNSDGTAAAPTCTSFDYYIVTDKDRTAGTITLKAYTSAGAVITDVTATGVTAGDYLIKYSSAKPDWSDIGTSNDYNAASYYFPGLESLAAADGRKVNGITMTGAVKGTHRDVSGQPLDSSDFQKLMSQIKLSVGANRYKYTKAMMAWESLDALIESRETDRRFQSIKDTDKGVESMGYVHGKDRVVFEADEFCPMQRIWVLPQGDAVQFYGEDFKFVEAQAGQKFMLKPNSSGHDRAVRAYMEGSGTLLCVHPAAVGVIKNFTVG
jgi:hypothetical protein